MQIFGLRAAWVDRESVAGYLLPQGYLREKGIHAWQAFKEERFAGSYKAALEELLAIAGSAQLIGGPFDDEPSPT